MEYRVIGQCRVAGVEPGGTVSQEALEEAGANIDALLGPHLEEIRDEPAPTAKPKTAKTTPPRDEA